MQRKLINKNECEPWALQLSKFKIRSLTRNIFDFPQILRIVRDYCHCILIRVKENRLIVRDLFYVNNNDRKLSPKERAREIVSRCEATSLWATGNGSTTIGMLSRIRSFSKLLFVFIDKKEKINRKRRWLLMMLNVSLHFPFRASIYRCIWDAQIG